MPQHTKVSESDSICILNKKEYIEAFVLRSRSKYREINSKVRSLPLMSNDQRINELRDSNTISLFAAHSPLMQDTYQGNHLLLSFSQGDSHIRGKKEYMAIYQISIGRTKSSFQDTLGF